MKKNFPKHALLMVITALLITVNTFAQTKTAKPLNIPFEPARWDTTMQKVEFTTYKGAKAMKILPGNKQVLLKDVTFTNGTIEFDTQPVDVTKSGFLSIYFRRQDAKESELVYLRCAKDETAQRNDAIQYAPIIHGVNLWDLMPHYQGSAPIKNEDWNHFKLVISGQQMKVYLNNMEKPVLEIPRLESNATAGGLAFDGQAYFANLVIKPNQIEWLSPQPGADLTNHDINYIRRWDVTASQFLEKGRELLREDLPTDTTKWQPIVAERRGLINLTRVYGGIENRGGGVQNKNRYVWLKTKIRCAKAQTVKMQLGFSDEVYVFINGGLIYTDKNQYPQPIRKYPDGRMDIANSTFEIPLKEGDNELVIGVSAYFYGWGIAARMMNMEGITVQQE
ncbi:hypothetical protein [Mucilaginibacter pedocola]|uniref:3-keto-disaccharide hydrolase domain-containing protein n=1 Tax=Mucilaginibacter pedocola TaxID=1792845 RepID=A0A1S9PI30_9SPHI|nr:hypothetical protein [Mucilaginibacter pedocola]OOQ60208.1 hypothetical protein BC343_25975 [Mucilaginibacter pedocola]